MRKLLGPMLALGLAAASAGTQVQAAGRPTLPNAADLQLPTELRSSEKYVARSSDVDVVVRFADPDLVSIAGAGYKQARAAGATTVTREAQIAHVRKLKAAQSAFVTSIASMNVKVLGSFQRALNGVALRVKASQINTLKGMPGVVSVRPIANYELDLSETVPYIGAKAVQDSGVDGTGITVAVLDSGIDYTHKNLGGAGTLAAYEAAYGVATTDALNTTRDGLFPTAKVIEGFDFVGEAWPQGDRTEDPDPIDLEGHGTHVADIIAGASADGSHKGVAPGSKLVAVKVCSAIASSCNGVALILATDYVLDPNRDGDMSDAVDVANLSLGASYGQVEDDLSFALGNVSQLGVVVVASAGNSADRPFIVGSPSMQKEVISVAQTAVPSAKTFPLVVTINGTPSTVRNTNTVEWAPIGAGFDGPVAFAGRACSPPDVPVADPIPDLTGKVALIDRGACGVSTKVHAAAAKGAIAVILANNVGGDPPSFSFAGPTPFNAIPTIIVTQGTGTSIKNALSAGAAVSAKVSPEVAISLVGSIVASSSRGPSYNYTLIKPEIGAPGASISAIAGTGDQTEAFGGTSGAAPMVAGSAALLLAARPNLSTREVKALLVNTGDANIQTNPSTQPGVLAPITRIGGGEVRVNAAVAAKTAAWATDTNNPTLSFGYHNITDNKTLKKRVAVKNFGSTRRTYTITPKFRYADDAASGAITPIAPATIEVPSGSTRSFEIALKVNAAALPVWTLNGGQLGGTGALLQSVEFDGYLEISDGVETIHVPWHVLPHKSAYPRVEDRKVDLDDGSGSTEIENDGVYTGAVEAFALTGVSSKLDEDLLADPGDNFVQIDLKAAGVRLVNFGDGDENGKPELGLQFAIASHTNRAHPAYPAEFDVSIDTDRDGNVDYILYNRELGTFASSGQCVIYLIDVAKQLQGPVFFCGADLKSGNMIMTIDFESIGLPAETIAAGSAISFTVDAFDNYFTGLNTDSIGSMNYELGNPRFLGFFQETLSPSTAIAPNGGEGTLSIIDTGSTFTNRGANGDGVLVLYKDAPKGKESELVRARP